MTRRIMLGVLVLAACEINPAFDPDAIVGSGSSSGGDEAGGPVGEPGVPLPDPCPALSEPVGSVITVSPDQAAELPSIVLDAPADSTIEYRFGRTQARVVNNLVTNEILDRDDAGVPVAGNAIVELTEFVDPLGGDVHLVEGSSAIDAGIGLGEDTVLHDIDGDPRDDRPDIGADER